MHLAQAASPSNDPRLWTPRKPLWRSVCTPLASPPVRLRRPAGVGGGAFGWEPGEWTDDTSMAIAIAEVAATGADLRDEGALDAIARRWHEWSQHAKDVGVQTCSVLTHTGRRG